MSIELSGSAFAAFIRSNRFVVVQFWAKWNHHDRAMSSLMESVLAERFQNQVAWGKLDVDSPENSVICGQIGLANLPFVALFKNGVQIRTITGLRSRDELTAMVQDLVADQFQKPQTSNWVSKLWKWVFGRSSD